jgi:hypothetical protein
VNVLQRVQSVMMVASVATLLAVWVPIDSRAQGPERPALGGLWTLNQDLSDQPPGRPEGGGDRDNGGDRSGDRSGGGGGGMGRGGGRRGGGGFGGRGGGMGRDSSQGNPEDAARIRDAIRDITQPPAHLTITQSESMVVLTGPDGRTTRLSPDGQKVKDENTKMERKTKWDGGKLVSEISGLGPGKMTQTFSLDPEHHQLRITVLMEGGRGQPRTIAHVYEPDAR